MCSRAASGTAAGWTLLYASQTQDNNTVAFHLFQEALRVDPQAVSALTGLGFTHLRYVINGWTDRYGEHLQKADELIARAIVMTPLQCPGLRTRCCCTGRKAQPGGHRGG
jgi:hypothetical protein